MTQEALNKRIKTTKDLRGIVSTMKMLSSVSVGQFERALKSLNQCTENIRSAFQGLFAQENFHYEFPVSSNKTNQILCIIIGTDNGLVGRFNRDVLDKIIPTLSDKTDKSRIRLITIGKRLSLMVNNSSWSVSASYNNSNTVKEIPSLACAVLTKINQLVSKERFNEVWLFYTDRKNTQSFVQARQLIPFQTDLLMNLKTKKWDGKTLPLVTADHEALFSALTHEYFTVLLTHALTASLAAEHYTRMIHMQQAEKNIDERLNNLQLIYQQARQNQITDELIDIVSGAEALNKIKRGLDKFDKNA